MAKTNKEQVNELLDELTNTSGTESLETFSRFLGYELIKNPIEPASDWLLVSHPELDNDSQALLSLTYDEALDETTTVRELRKRYESVETQKERFKGYDVYLYVFIGKGRILIFKGYDSNRDERLDISKESVSKVSLFADNLLALAVDKIAIQDDEFGFGKEVIHLDILFKRELSQLFGLTVQLYRKQIAELITTNQTLEEKIMTLLPTYEKETLQKQSLQHKLLNLNFKQAIGSVIDTIVLRVVLRRFLESYHGFDAFSSQDDFKDIGLGVREGKMQEVIKYLAEIEYKNISERSLQHVIKSEGSGQVTWDLFEDVSLGVIKKETEVPFEEIYARLRRQFEIAYGGDLFSGDISEVVNSVEEEINRINPDLLLHLLVDTSEERFNFRYEDLPPEMIQDFYETSMGHSLHYVVSDKGEPIVTYSDDLQERKQKGAYYTKQELVDYMVAKTVGRKVEEFQVRLNKAIKEENQANIESALKEITSLTILDITCGGGSFLRGAFRFLSMKRDGIVRTLESITNQELYEKVVANYPYFKNDNESEALWEKHVLIEMVYGVDIDYKALIISSQTLTLSALNNWKVGVNFPRLIGLTLAQQNALIGPVRVEDREEVFGRYKEEIKELIQVRKKIRQENNAQKSSELAEYADKIRLSIQGRLNQSVEGIIGEEYKEALMSQSIEVNFPEVFFKDNGELKKNPGFSITLGNPPWEIWKPNSDEFFSVYNPEFRSAKRREKMKMQQDIFQKHAELKEKWEWLQGYYEAGSSYFLQNEFYSYQRVKVHGELTGSDINLYKVATEKNFQVLAKDGTCSYLIPSSAYTDLGSTGIRRMLFDKTDLQEIAGFENRKGIFENVDGRYKFAVVTFTKGGKTENFKGFFYKHGLEALHQPENLLDIPMELVRKLSPTLLSVLEFREQKELELVKKMAEAPPLQDKLEGKWNARFLAEFHKTNNSNLFNTEGEGNPLYEGKNIWHFENNDNFVYYVEEEKARKLLEQKERRRISRLKEVTALVEKLPIHSDYYRLAYRSVASSTNKRTFISTILPKKVYCAHSLNATIPYELKTKNGKIVRKPYYTLRELPVMTALFNSFVVDFVLRRKITTNVTMSFVYELPVPRLSEGDKYFEEIMQRSASLLAAKEGFEEIQKATGIESGVSDPKLRQRIQNQIDAYVGKIYNLERDELLYVLSTFKSPNHAEEMQEIAQDTIEQFDILTEQGGLEWPN